MHGLKNVGFGIRGSGSEYYPVALELSSYCLNSLGLGFLTCKMEMLVVSKVRLL